MKTVTLYTDGACSGNPGPGGWGAILEFKGTEKELSGGEVSTTNNRMELTAVIRGLEALKEPCVVTVTSDSKYVVDALTKGWLDSWIAHGWKKADGKPALNVELWQRLVIQLKRHQVKFEWVKGHAGHPYNERCDRLATAYAGAETPLITVINGHAIGAAFVLLGSKALGADLVYAVDNSEIGALAAESGVAFAWDKYITEEKTREELVSEWRASVSSPVNAASSGEIDDIISISEIRARICSALLMLSAKGQYSDAAKCKVLPL